MKGNPQPTVEEIIRAVKTLGLTAGECAERVISDFETGGWSAAEAHLSWIDTLLAAHDAGRYEHGQKGRTND